MNKSYNMYCVATECQGNVASILSFYFSRNKDGFEESGLCFQSPGDQWPSHIYTFDKHPRQSEFSTKENLTGLHNHVALELGLQLDRKKEYL